MLVAGLLGMAELGYRAHARWGGSGRRSETGDEAQMAATALGLLALLLGFTFSMALNRYDERRAEVVQEANDIGTAWLRAGLYGTPAATTLQDRLRRYAETRIATPAAPPQEGDAAPLRDQIWALTAATVRPEPGTAQAAALVAAVNAVLDTATARDAALGARVPGTVLVLLVVYALVASFLNGYVLGAFGSRHLAASAILYLLLAMTITLILDLDRPQGGTIRVTQQPLIDAVRGMAPR